MNKIDTAGGRLVPVWDIPTRLFHWSLAALVATSWATAELGWLNAHFLSGYVILSLLLFRLGWGLIGSQSARFSDFLKGPRAALEHIREMRLPARHAPPVLGHNPLGGWMVMTLLLILLVQAVSGLFTSDDIMVDGPLVTHASGAAVKLLSTVHRLGFNLIMVLVATHVGVVMVYLHVRKENLIRPMVTGHKEVPDGVAVEAPRRTGVIWAVLTFALAAAAVASVVRLG
jgi:cytochrome b